MAKARQVVVLGTGVNPGFVMDTMAVAATAPCLDVKHVAVERVVDASSRRENLQRKIGAGLTTSEFRKGVKKKQLGHVGLLESTYLVAEGLGWSLEKVKEKVTPVTSKKRIKTDYLNVEAGDVAGIHHVCKGYRNGKECVSLDLQMYVGAKKPTDRILVKGDPDVELTFSGGVAGDQATVAMLISMVPAVRKMEHGVRTMVDAPVPHFRAPS